MDLKIAVELLEAELTEERTDALINKLVSLIPSGLARSIVRPVLDALLPEKLIWALREVLPGAKTEEHAQLPPPQVQ